MNAVTEVPFILTDDQQSALDKFVAFLLDSEAQVFVLEGYAGTGKSTLIKTLVDRLPGYIKMHQLIDARAPQYQLQLTATTNKAAEAFSHVTGMDVLTIHSFLGLRVHTDYSTGISTLIPKDKEIRHGYLLFIDEASYVDRGLLDIIFKKTSNCKIIFIGDRAQLTPVKSLTAPVFEAGFNGAMLEKVMRQASDNPIITAATMFRETVKTGEWGAVKIDGNAIIHLPRSDFEDQIIREFTRPDWRYHDSKILAWTNKCVINYNHAINNHLTGDPSFQSGDYAVCNKMVSNGGKDTIKTDQMVYITSIGPDIEELGVPGNFVEIDHRMSFFFPKSLQLKNERIKEAKANAHYSALRTIDMTWIDLRAAFAQTVNKSQGSTYNEVFIDLDDIKRCNSGDQLARMLYVAFSRARNRVWLTGDFV